MFVLWHFAVGDKNPVFKSFVRITVNSASVVLIVQHLLITVESDYNDVGLYDTSLIESDILWYQLIPHCQP
jgi:hypothetical protein